MPAGGGAASTSPSALRALNSHGDPDWPPLRPVTPDPLAPAPGAELLKPGRGLGSAGPPHRASHVAPGTERGRPCALTLSPPAEVAFLIETDTLVRREQAERSASANGAM